jgi:glutaminyl-tRNA synthetase
MKAGKFADGEHILRAKISEDARSPNMNLRDPAIYRIRHAHHVRTGDAWCIYPMYDYAPDFGRAGKHHPLDLHPGIPGPPPVLRLAAGNPVEAASSSCRCRAVRILAPEPDLRGASKRKLRQLVEEKIVDGWDDPRMPTIVGLRRRGYTPEAIQLFCERIGVTKADGWIDMSVLEGCVREDLDPKAPRATAVLRPLKLIIDNFPEGQTWNARARAPAPPELGVRTFPSRASCGSRRLHGSADQGLLPPTTRRSATSRAAACACATAT